MNARQLIKATALVSISAFLGACSSSDSTDNSVDCFDCAVISTVSADFTSSAVQFTDTIPAYEISSDYAAQDLSDVRFLTFGDHFYRMGRFGINNLAKFSFDDAENPIWEYSVAKDDSDNPNPYTVVFVSETQAYVLPFGTDEIIEINPSVTDSNQQSDFIVDRLDYSKYSFGNGIGASDGFVKDGLLYVLLNGQDSSFVPQTSRILVIDPSTNLEVDVNGSGEAYDLTVKNAQDMDVVGGYIYVAGVGRYASLDRSRPAELTGGIEKVDIRGMTYLSTLLVDDNDASVNAQIAGVEVSSSDNKAYLIRYNAFQDNDLIQFNPTSGAVSASPNDGFSGLDIKTIEIDSSNQLWVALGDTVDPRIEVISIADDSSVATINTIRNPVRIEFADTTN
ncbi:hypothetical protein A3762_05785 [Oleiphilus sp. HI0125]|uniref:hypothetical protein n=2 Tax=Oleiphilus sp. HI0125 TaxID=1822266 RepID=UPI0007C32F11|nr:hypothetical protein [Oleiphilus sp. HI0125]KZZ59160.1 hypothetical protein A3762_05785 [Oleiphilus sp. HI0125]